MKLPQFRFRRKIQPLDQDEKVFDQASELAQLRLEQCIADLRLDVPPAEDTLLQRGDRTLRSFTNPF